MTPWTQAYQQIRPCIDQHGHKFAANLVRVVVCERCGITRSEASHHSGSDHAR